MDVPIVYRVWLLCAASNDIRSTRSICVCSYSVVVDLYYQAAIIKFDAVYEQLFQDLVWYGFGLDMFQEKSHL